MKSRRLNMCFSNPEVIRLIEQSGNNRPSAVIHDLVIKGLLFDKLLLGQLIQDVRSIKSEAENIQLPTKQVIKEKQPVSQKQEIKPEPPKPEIKPEIIQIAPVEEYPSYNPNCLGDLGMDF